MVVARIQESRRVSHGWANSAGFVGIQRSARTAMAIEQLEREQDHGSMLVLPAYFEPYESEVSIRAARGALAQGEFFLGAFEVGISLLTHNAFRNFTAIDCAGDECRSPTAPFTCDHVPFFQLSNDLQFGQRYIGNTISQRTSRLPRGFG